MPKMIYAAKRNPSTTHDGFLTNWAGHAELSGRFPEIFEPFRRVVQCDAQPGGLRVAGASDEYDGVNLLTMRSMSGMTAVWDQPAILEHMEPDELRVFSGLIRDCTVFAAEEIVGDGPITDHVAIRFVRRRAGVDRREFTARTSGGGRRSFVVDEASELRRLVHDHVMLETPPAFDFDLVEEYWFDSAEARQHFFEQDAVQQEFSDQTSVVDADGSVLVVADVCLSVPPIHR